MRFSVSLNHMLLDQVVPVGKRILEATEQSDLAAWGDRPSANLFVRYSAQRSTKIS